MKALLLVLALAGQAQAQAIDSSGAPGTLQAGSTYTVSGLTATGPVSVSSAVFVGLSVSTQAVGGAGAAVTALCLQGGSTGLSYATGGGCDCTGGVAVTGVLSRPNCVTAGCVPTGWTCQEPGGTGGACIAYAMCSRLQ